MKAPGTSWEPPMRQVHLDFHTSAASSPIATDFSPDKFAQTLVDASVDSVLLFARCHHGWMYYDSTAFPERRHPGLSRDLLKEQVAACRERGLATPIYLTVQWDNFTAAEHPEWRIVGPGGQLEGTPPYEAGFYRKLCLNSPFRDFMFRQAKDVLDSFDVDGLYFDFIRPDDCSCVHCQQAMLDRGIDPTNEVERRTFGMETINDFELAMSAFVRSRREGVGITYNGGHIGLRHRQIRDAYTHFELETLPSGGWGYNYFPITQRYARSLGRPTIGTTGMFHTTWGDYRSYKNKAALEYEVFRMLAAGSGTCIGDQLEPSGVLDPEVYRLVGDVFASVREKEPWCAGATPVVDLAVLHPEEFLGGGVRNLPASINGVTRMLEEAGLQFDIVDSAADLSRYRLLVLPDFIAVEGQLVEKLAAYLDEGGKVIASFASGFTADRTAVSMSQLGVELLSEGPRDASGRLARGRAYPRHDYSNYLATRAGFGAAGVGRVHVMHMLGMDIGATRGATVLADAIPSTFDRSFTHFASHLQSPPAVTPSGAAVVATTQSIYFAHPIFHQYEASAPLWCKTLFLTAVDHLLPERVVRHDGPSTVRVSVNDQVESDQVLPDRRVVHLLHYVPERRGDAFDVIEDVIPVHDLSVTLRVPGRPTSVYLAPQRKPLAFEAVDGTLTFQVDALVGHQIVCVEFSQGG